MAIKENEKKYIIWQNRATDFYLSTRHLCLKKAHPYRAALFCGQQAMELLLKATLTYWDRSFNQIHAGHDFRKMLRIMKNKVPKSNSINIPDYFFYERFYQETTRYPDSRRPFIPIPGSFLDDLDKVFYDLICLVPFQFNSMLSNAVSGHDKTDLNILRRKNRQMKGLRRFLSEH